MIFWKCLKNIGFICILLTSCYSLKIPKIFLQKSNKINQNNQIQESLITPKNRFPITGFYGLIGPKIDYKKVSSLYDLFTGDGIIQGVFLENGTATFSQSLINTEKRQFERTYGVHPYSKTVFVVIINMLLNYLRLMPNMLGVANTAFLQVQNKTYVLFERDMPYEIAIDSNKKEIQTIQKQNIPFMKTFSGHSKVINGNIESIEYNILTNQVVWYQVDNMFKKLREIPVQMKYLPMVHDFFSDEKYIILIDSPIKVDWSNIFFKNIPLFFDKMEPTFIYLIDKATGKIESYKSDRSFYLFHYSDVKIKENTINILSPFYDNIDYNEVLHNGKYRRLRIDRIKNTTQMFKYRELEPLNLDFPVPIEKNKNVPIKQDQYVLRNIENGRINGFYILEKTDIVKKVLFDEYFICGEPGILYLETDNMKNNKKTTEPILVCFGVNELSKTQYFIMVNLETDVRVEYPISYPLFIGFHSIVLSDLLHRL